MAFKLSFLQKNICSENVFFSKVFGNFTKKLTPSHAFFKDFCHKFARKPNIAVIFKNTFFTERYKWLLVFVRN